LSIIRAVRAITIEPLVHDSARLDEVPEPSLAAGGVLVRSRAVGVCGTDIELCRGEFGEPPPGCTRLVLGHESLGDVLEAPEGSGIEPGQPVVGIVRLPDGCDACAAGEWDMCRTGLYVEHGIKGLHGFAAERFRLPLSHVVAVDPGLGLRAVLLEPASVVAKAWEQIDRIVARSSVRPRRTLVTGAGPVGLLGALLARQRNLEVHVLDRVTDGPKPALARALGAEYHATGVPELGAAGMDVILECTGSERVIADALLHVANDGIVCLVGNATPDGSIKLDVTTFNRRLLLGNIVVFGTVNANRRHYEAAADALAAAEPAWLDALITRQVALDRWHDALVRQRDDVKPIIAF
jgi:glucose 1-dehydrogenase